MKKVTVLRSWPLPPVEGVCRRYRVGRRYVKLVGEDRTVTLIPTGTVTRIKVEEAL